MTRLDSDIMGIVMALLTFLVPVISAIMEKNRKKKKGRGEDILPDSNPLSEPQQDLQQEPQPQQMSDIEEMFNQLLGIDTKSQEEEETVVPQEVPGQKPEVELEVEPEVEFEEARPQTVTLPQEEAAPVKKGLRERLADNPKDMVIFAEIMNPKFKEL